MTFPVVRAYPVFYNQKKMGEVHGAAFNIDGARKKLFGAEGMLSLSRGSVTCGVDVQFITPVAGTSFDVLIDLLNQNDVEIQMPINGHVMAITMGLTSGSFSSETETGVAEGKATLEGGAPKILI